MTLLASEPAAATGRAWWERAVRAPITWVAVVVLGTGVPAIISQLDMIIPNRRLPNGEVTGTGVEAFRTGIVAAIPTLAVLVIAFVLVDRYRPQRVIVWVVTLVWGGAIATWISIHLNTWVAAHLSLVGDGDPAAAPRAAVFVAPFVEESAKATVLFVLALALPREWTSRVSGVVLGGLAGAGFAFFENGIYYARAYRSAALTDGPSPLESLLAIALQRGVLTFAAHPIFTMMTGVGVAVALRTRSKRVRVLAPVTGFVLAALLHMAFNGTVSVVGTDILTLWLFVLLPFAVMVVIRIWSYLASQSRLLRDRGQDYVRAGLLTEAEADLVGRSWRRGARLWRALRLRRFLPTLAHQRAVTELVCLRDAMTRGVVGAEGLADERRWVRRVDELRDRALVERPVETPAPADPVGSWGPPMGGMPIAAPAPSPSPAQPGYAYPPPYPAPYPAPPYPTPPTTAPVDPSWGPPRG